MTLTIRSALAVRTRSGMSYWLASLRSMTRFEMGRARQWAALMVLVQILMGAGMALMYGFFYPRITYQTALYITTGTPTLALIPIGFVLVPASVGQEKLAGTFDFTWSLPVPRSAQAVATFLLFTVLSLPGAVLALAVASWRYGVRLDISPLIIPGTVLCALMAISVGFGMALAISNPLLINLITNTLIFVVLLFSPIVVPASHFPAWLLAVDRALPFYNMAEVIRAGLSSGLVIDLTRSYLILLAWTIAGWAMTAWVVGRRRLQEGQDMLSETPARPGTGRRVENTIMSTLVRAGLVPRCYLLTTRGRKTGKPRSNPVVPVEHDGRRWLIAPYGPVSWVRNARAAGRVSLARGRTVRYYVALEVPAAEAGPVLKQYVRLAPAARRSFQAGKHSPVKAFSAEADRHPVFELMPADERGECPWPS